MPEAKSPLFEPVTRLEGARAVREEAKVDGDQIVSQNSMVASSSHFSLSTNELAKAAQLSQENDPMPSSLIPQDRKLSLSSDPD